MVLGCHLSTNAPQLTLYYMQLPGRPLISCLCQMHMGCILIITQPKKTTLNQSRSREYCGILTSKCLSKSVFAQLSVIHAPCSCLCQSTPHQIPVAISILTLRIRNVHLQSSKMFVPAYCTVSMFAQ